MFPQLPTELKISILQNTDKRSLPAVLRANSTFRDIAEPILYYHVALAPFVRQGAFAGASIACFHGLVARPTAAAAVRRLTLNFYQDYMRNIDFTVMRRVIEAFRETLPGLLNVEKLIIAHWNDRLPGIHLPQSLPLRSLQHYRGPPELLQDVQSRDLVNLRVYTSRPNFEVISRALLAAARGNNGKLRALELDRAPDDSDEKWLEFIPKIHSLFPNVRFLGLGPWRNDQVDRIVESMAKFQNIRLFSMLDTWDDWRHGRQRLVERLCIGCPRLRAIRLGNEEWRFSDILDGWITTGYGLESVESARIWKEADYRKYLVDPECEGFVYNSLDL